LEAWRPDLRLLPSLHLSLVAGGLGLLTAIALATLPVFVYIKFILLLLFARMFWVFIWRRIRLESKDAVQNLRYTDAGWFIRCAERGNTWQEVALLGDSVVTARYVYLRLSPVESPWYWRKVYPVLIAADSLTPEQFRRLKVFLRFIY
jgi:hypothetical protein